jgi:hypothetical protein
MLDPRLCRNILRVGALAVLITVAISGCADDTPRADPPGPTACPAHALGISATGGGPVSNGFTGATIRFTNTGTAPCRVAARISGLSAVVGGTTRALPAENAVSDHGGPQVLHHGEAAILSVASIWLHGSGTCLRLAPADLVRPRELAIELPGTGRLVARLPGDGAFILQCWPIEIGRLTRAGTT